MITEQLSHARRYRRIRNDGGRVRYKAPLALIAMVVASPAFARILRRAGTDDQKVQGCGAVPTDKTWVQIGPMSFKTRDEADKQVSVICKEKHE